MPARSVSTLKLIARRALLDREAHDLRDQPANQHDTQRDEQPGQELPAWIRNARTGSNSKSTVPSSFPESWPRRSARPFSPPECREAPAAGCRPRPAGCRARSAARRAPSRSRTARSSRRRCPRRIQRAAARRLRSSRRGSWLASSLPGRRQARRASAGLVRGRIAQAPSARVVERAQHAGDVAQRTRACAALLERTRGLALEIDDQEVVAREQDLPEVEVAVVARLQQRAFRSRTALDARDQALAQASNAASDACASSGNFAARSGRKSSVCVAARRRWRPVPATRPAPGSSPNAGSPLGSASARCSSADSRAERVREMRGRHRARPAAHFAGQGRTLLDEALQIVEREAPAVALVGDVGLQQRERGRRAVGADTYSTRSGDRHAVREARHVGEEAPDLELRVDARAAAAGSP